MFSYYFRCLAVYYISLRSSSSLMFCLSFHSWFSLDFYLFFIMNFGMTILKQLDVHIFYVHYWFQFLFMYKIHLYSLFAFSSIKAILIAYPPTKMLYVLLFIKIKNPIFFFFMPLTEQGRMYHAKKPDKYLICESLKIMKALTW